MSCNSCAKPFTLLRKEKGCPSCGFSYCSKCIVNKAFVPKLNAETKVCAKCSRAPISSDQKPVIVPPDAYYKRVGLLKGDSMDKSDATAEASTSDKEQEIANRLKKLKEDKIRLTTEQEISQKLQMIKGDIPQTTDAELLERLAKLRGVPVSTVQSQPVVFKPDLRTEQEQADDLMKQYLEQNQVDAKYKDEFDGLVSDMESRLSKLKGAEGNIANPKPLEVESEDEEETVKKIIEKVRATAALEDDDDLPPSTDDELPFCEICNEDATMRCLGCRYLFCKRCFMDHKDDDDGCNRYETYSPSKGVKN